MTSQARLKNLVVSLGGATVLLTSLAASVEAATFTKITGTFEELQSTLMAQTWWGDSNAALEAALAARAAGVFGQESGSVLSNPFSSSDYNLTAFYVDYDEDRVGIINVEEGGDCGFELDEICIEETYLALGVTTRKATYIIEQRNEKSVPEPAVLLGLVAVGGVGALMRRTLASCSRQ